VTGMVEIVRRVVRSELARAATSTLGVVTAVHAHTAEDDENNYEVDVRLKHDDLQLQRLPVTVPHAGAAAPARVGDLVLVQPLDGELNQALVTGRFYHADERPPLHEEGEVLLEHRVPDGTLNHLRFAKDGSIVLQRDVTKPEDNSEAKTTVRIDGASGDVRIAAGEDVVIELVHDGEVKITATDKPVGVTCKTLTVDGDAKINGKLEVVTGGKTTTIKGGEIAGS
jgi:hypothetical protein